MTSKKTRKQQEELPSFLLNLNQIPSELKLPIKETCSVCKDHYLGPLFFGECLQHHPPHVIPREHLPPAIFTTISEQDILENMFVAASTGITNTKTREPGFQKWHHAARKRKSFEPPVSHYRGVRKAFVPEVGPHELDFGETESEISGEMCREVPICRVTSCSSISEQCEMVNLSDVREKNRPFMPYNERIAHSHFLKEFVTVQIIGPKIPAAITIKKLPTKRKRLSEFNFQLQSKKNKQEVSGDNIKEETTEEKENEENEEEDSTWELMKPISINEGLDDTLEDVEMETPSGMVYEEGSYEEWSIEEEYDGLIDDDGKDRKLFYSDKQELDAKEQIETEDGGELLENERPTEEQEVKEEN